MTSRLAQFGALMGAAILISCGGSSESTPTQSSGPVRLSIVSGSNQTADVGAALSAPIIVEAVNAANQPASGVAITWTVTGGGSVSPPSGTTGSDGTASATWTLGPTPGTQVATATSAQITGASASFVASNGPTITGTVSLSALPTTFALSVARGARAARPASLGVVATSASSHAPKAHSNRILVGFRAGALSVASAGSATYRSMAAARSTAALMQQRLAALVSAFPVSNTEISPAILSARLTLSDTTQATAVMSALRADPGVAWVEPEHVVTVRDGAPHPVQAPSLSSQPTSGITSAAATLPNDPNFYLQYWAANMVDLPRAWAITTGSTNVIVASVDMGVRFDDSDVSANFTSDGYDFVSQWGYGSAQPICGGGTFLTVDGDGDGPDPDPTDPNDLEFDDIDLCWAVNSLGDHGLYTAGLIGSTGNDGAGNAGVAWSVRIRPIRVLGITGDGMTFDIAQGVLYAAGLPAAGKGGQLVQAPSRAQIINMSIGGDEPDSAESAAVAAAAAAGSLIVASAGNETTDLPSYPAGYPNVMAVSAVGMDGVIASYSNGGPNISVAAPGGEFRLDDNGGDGVLGPGWDFVRHRATFLFGYGTSASAPYVSGIAALIFAQNPGLTAAAVRQRIEQYATRAPGTTRNNNLGWGIVDAYNALTQTSGPARQTYARLIDATTGNVVKTVSVNSAGVFSLTQVAAGSYFLQAGQDEAGDGVIGVPGRRFGWAGGASTPATLTLTGGQMLNTAINAGIPMEVEPNDAIATANMLSVGSYVVGQINTPDAQDVYKVLIPTGGQYTFETSGLVGSCGWGLELDTVLLLQNSTGSTLATNDNFTSATSRFCSHITTTLTAGTYYIIVSGTTASGLSAQGRYQLAVRAGT